MPPRLYFHCAPSFLFLSFRLKKKEDFFFFFPGEERLASKQLWSVRHSISHSALVDAGLSSLPLCPQTAPNTVDSFKKIPNKHNTPPKLLFLLFGCFFLPPHILHFIFKMIESFWPDISTSEVSGKIREINSKIQISQQF